MKLTGKDWKRYQELTKKLTSGTKLTSAEVEELAKLRDLKETGGGGSRGKKGTKATKVTNDINWWNKYPTLLKDSSNLPFNLIKGTAIRRTAPKGNGLEYDSSEYANGMLIRYLRSIGNTINANSSYNMQMRSLWLDMHRKYRGLGAYEWTDLGMAIFAIACLFADVSRAERVYGTINNFKAENRSIPVQLLYALGIDASVISGDDIANYRYNLNRIINKLSILCLPKGLGVLESWITLDGAVFKDSDSARAAWYVYDTWFKCIYDHDTLTQDVSKPYFGGCVRYVGRKRTGTVNHFTGSKTYEGINSSFRAQTLQDIIDDLNDLADALLVDTDVARMCSDILAAYSDSEVMVMREVPEDYIVEAVRDDVRLMQLHNTSLVGVSVGPFAAPSGMINDITIADTSANAFTAGLTVYQSNGTIYQQWSAAIKNPSDTGYSETVGSFGTNFSYTYVGNGPSPLPEGYGKKGYTLIDMWKDDITDVDVVELTRQHVGIDVVPIPGGTNVFKLSAHSNIVCQDVFIYYGSGIANNTVNIQGIEFSSTLGVVDIGLLNQLDWHPLVVAVYTSGGSEYFQDFGDLDNYRTIDTYSLSKMHDAALLSGFKFDKVGNIK